MGYILYASRQEKNTARGRDPVRCKYWGVASFFVRGEKPFTPVSLCNAAILSILRAMSVGGDGVNCGVALCARNYIELFFLLCRLVVMLWWVIVILCVGSVTLRACV